MTGSLAKMWGPFGKGLVGSDDGGGVFLVTGADDLEEDGGVGLIEAQITDSSMIKSLGQVSTFIPFMAGAAGSL
jgi:hypothetical protein